MNTLAASQAAPAAPKAVTLQFNDNALLPLLFGDHDRNLVRLEQGLGVRLSSRGNRVAISGDPTRVQAAELELMVEARDPAHADEITEALAVRYVVRRA